jgi:hypothetical protein
MAGSEWRQLGCVLPRAHWSKGVIELDLDYLGVTDDVRLRLVGTGHHKLDVVAFLIGTQTQVSVTTVQPISATHSRDGSVLDSLLASDYQYVELIPGERVRLDFPYSSEDSTLVRDFILRCDGYYITPPGDPLMGPQARARMESVWLGQNSPNPFRIFTVIPYSLPVDTWIKLAIYDIQGREVKTLVEGPLGQGYHQSVWDGCNRDGLRVSPGIYFCRLDCYGFSRTRKVIVSGEFIKSR